MLKFYKVDKYYYGNNDKPYYDVMPYHFWGHLKCCRKYYGIKGLKWCYLFRWQAERKARKLNNGKTS